MKCPKCDKEIETVFINLTAYQIGNLRDKTNIIESVGDIETEGWETVHCRECGFDITNKIEHDY
jgi:hypothetical protein